MSNNIDGGAEFRSDGNSENPAADSKSGDGGDGSDGGLGFDSWASAAALDRVSVPDADRSIEARDSYNGKESVDVKMEKDESEPGGGSGGAPDNHPSSSVKPVAEDYDSMLSEFDQYASKGAGDAVGYGYEIGDMVWGKVKSHPWWPGYIYNEALASVSVSKAKRSGHVLVAFFGDGSYGWFELAELVPFAENFAEKSRQVATRGFLKAVEEAVGEFSRRRSLALACRCRNEFNFWPSKVEGYYAVDVGDLEPGVYSLSQINKSRDDFEPKEMLSFIDQLALKPKTNQQGTIEFIKNKATVLACRKAIYEEFDETYAQAFGTTPVRPPRPNLSVAVDPVRAPLSGPLVFAETLGKGKTSTKTTKMKEPVEDRYIFKRRDEPVPMIIKKPTAGQASSSAQPFLVDGSGLNEMSIESGTKSLLFQTSVSVMDDNQIQAISYEASMTSDVKPIEGSRKTNEGGIRKVKAKMQLAKAPSAENATLVEKKKKRKKDTSTDKTAGELTAASVNLVETKKKKQKRKKENETSAALVPVPVGNSEVAAAEKVSGMLVDIPVIVNNKLDAHKDSAMTSSFLPTIEKPQAVDDRKSEFSTLVKDLQALALNPYHGHKRNCPATAKRVFLKFRTHVYQKSLVSSPSEAEKGEATVRVPTDKPKVKPKLVKPLGRPDDPTKGGKKRDRPESAKKKQVDETQDADKKKRIDTEGIKKKKKKIVGDSKPTSVEKKIPQKPTEIQRENVKTITHKNSVLSSKGMKPESSKRTDLAPAARTPDKPTMLIMKFPSGASLPSPMELRAKFTRFGPMDHKATRVLWKSFTCRLVFWKQADAEAALKYVSSTNNLFGNNNIRSFTREVEVEAPEPEPVRIIPRGDESVAEPRAAGRQPIQTPGQLKSCLKKPGGEEDNGNGNNGRGTRVKFVLGGEGNNSKTEQVGTNIAAATTSSYALPSMDISSSSGGGCKNMTKLIQESIGTTTTSSSSYPHNHRHHHHQHYHHQLQRFSASGGSGRGIGMGMGTGIGMGRGEGHNDISQQFLKLLTRCSDVVNTLSGALGYVPYHSL